MESKKIRPCSWKDCPEPPSKHVRFGYRALGSNDLAAASAASYTILHRNLCETHLVNIQATYMDVAIFEMGTCPSCDSKMPDLPPQP